MAPSLRLTTPLIAAILLIALATGAQNPARRSAEELSTAPPPAPERIEADGIPNLFRLSPRLYSGAQPEGEAGFAALKALGVKTIITVDGSRPDVATAHKFGMRYVHLPIGYDGVPREQGVRIAKALQTLPGPVFVHCHHGQHRGPAAAAVCGIATEGWSRKQAADWLKQAGTSPNYQGLYATVDAFTPPTPEELARAGDDFPELAEIPDLVERMVAIDTTWDHLKAIRAADFQTPADHPDLDPSHEALLLAEHFRESLRLPEVANGDPDFLQALQAAEHDATALEASLRKLGDDHRPAERAFQTLARQCNACHARYRNR